MKMYGNTKSDGFPMILAAIGALFVVGAWAMVHLSSFALIGGIAVFGLLIALMIVRISKWDVMSERDNDNAGVKAVTFQVAADTDVAAAPKKSPWLPTSPDSLPRPVENPKPSVETNAIV